MTSITLDFTFLTGLVEDTKTFIAPTRRFYEKPAPPTFTPQQDSQPAQGSSQPSRQEPVLQQPLQIQRNIPTDSQTRSSDGKWDCGVPNYHAPVAAGLVIGGLVVKPGQFPWFVAYD